MNEAEALAALAELQQRAQTAVAAGDVAAGEEVSLAAIWMKVEPETPSTRALGLAFGTLAAVLDPLVRPEATRGTLNRAAHAFQHAPDSQGADFVVTLNNLAAVLGRLGDNAEQATCITQIVRIAAAWSGEADASAAAIFMRFALDLRRTKQYAPMLPLLAQALRFMLTAPGFDDAGRATWLREHAQALREAGELDLLRADLDRATATLGERADTALSLGLCDFERSHFLAAQGNWPDAAAAIDRALAAPGLPAREQTELFSLAARAWFKAGDFERSSERSQRALRRRIGLAD